MKNLASLIEKFGGVTAFGREIWPDSEHPAKRADLARRRECLPIKRWSATIRRAKARGITVTREQLAAWSEKQAGKQFR